MAGFRLALVCDLGLALGSTALSRLLTPPEKRADAVREL